MATENNRRRVFSLSFFVILSVFICVHLWMIPPPGFAQDETPQEVAVNLAEGRVVICAAKDGIILATIDSHNEAGSRPPAIAILSGVRAGVMLGAVEWVQPDSKDKPIRLDSEFPRLAAAATNTGGRTDNSNAASDLEAIGVSVLERVRQVTELLHHKINLGTDEPLIRLVLVGYVRGYGPEAWTIDYYIRQEAFGNDYWRTSVLRPSYNQLYPPEKGKPHTLIEARYPPANRAKDTPELIDLLRQNDPRLAKSRVGNDDLTKSLALILGGESQKSPAASDVQFLKAALPAVTSPDAKISMAYVDFDRGFQWVLQPPEAPPPPTSPSPADNTPQEQEAPTLRRKSEK